MGQESNDNLVAPEDAALRIYLLGQVEFEAALLFQRRLLYEVSGNRSQAALVLCEHPPLITVGRQGSSLHILAEPRELRSRMLRVRWVNRGGGCLLHTSGQLAIYPILPLDRLGLSLKAYLCRLQATLIALLDDFGIGGEDRPSLPGVWTGPRLLAPLGVAVRDWVTYFGAYLNINPTLEPFRLIHCGGPEGRMTSLERERRGPLRPSLVRERLLEHFLTQFPFARTALFSDHPALTRRATAHAFASPA
jgi:lipoyl(octanoyl) transferase